MIIYQKIKMEMNLLKNDKDQRQQILLNKHQHVKNVDVHHENKVTVPKKLFMFKTKKIVHTLQMN